MTEKNDSPESNPDPALPDSVEGTASSSDQENVAAESAPEESPPAENLATKTAWPESSPAAKSSFSFMPLLLILVLGAAGGGSFWIYEGQKKLHQEVQAGFNQMTSRLDNVEADMQRLQKNQQQLETSSRAFQAHQSEVAETFKSHENSMSTLDEDVVRLKEELNHLAKAQAAIPETGAAPPSAKTETEPASDDLQEERTGPEVLAAGQAGDPAQPAAGGAGPNFDQRSIIAGDNTKPEPSASPASGEPTEAELNDPERSQEAQKYIDFVESTTAKFFRLVKEGFVNLWQWFISLF